MCPLSCLHFTIDSQTKIPEAPIVVSDLYDRPVTPLFLFLSYLCAHIPSTASTYSLLTGVG